MAMTDEEIEQQYNPRKAVSDVEQHALRIAALSERVRHARVAAGRARLDLRYGTEPLSTLDVFPAEAANAPIHVFLHGGYWRGRDKSDYSCVADALVPHGITTVVMNYDLCPSVELPAIVEQVRQGFAWVHAHAAELGGDPKRFTASGHSAGAHLIAAALSADRQGGAGTRLPQAAVLVSGIYELEPVLRVSVNKEIRLQPGQVDAMSPMRHPPLPSVPLVVAVGGAETTCWVAESRNYAETCSRQGSQCLYAELPGANHYTVLSHLESPSGWLSRMVASLAFG